MELSCRRDGGQNPPPETRKLSHRKGKPIANWVTRDRHTPELGHRFSDWLEMVVVPVATGMNVKMAWPVIVVVKVTPVSTGMIVVMSCVVPRMAAVPTPSTTPVCRLLIVMTVTATTMWIANVNVNAATTKMQSLRARFVAAHGPDQ
jgi:hypothetical protein